MASAARTAFARSSKRCRIEGPSCRRGLATEVPVPSSSSSQAAPAAPKKKYRTVASALVSRPPLLLPPLHPLEATHLSYQRQIARALGKSRETTTSWFFPKRGSSAEKAFTEFDELVAGETGAEGQDEVVKRAVQSVDSGSGTAAGSRVDVAGPEHPDRKKVDADEKSLERKLDRTLYLVLKKDRKENAWQFPQGGVEAGESLVEAASRELSEEAGANLDVWPTGRVPAGAFSYAFPAGFSRKDAPGLEGANVFFMPMRLLRGKPEISKKEGLTDFAWLTKEEVKGRVGKEYWEAVEGMLD